jgi:WS/DGAT/MGAT family acyltransferase
VPWSDRLTSRRNIAYTSVPLDDVKRTAKNADVKVNDVVLSLFAGALRRYLVARDALPRRSLVAAVPVSTRDGGDLGGNALAAVFVALGTDLDDPGERLQAVHATSKGARDLFDAMGAEGLLEWIGVFAPATIAAGASVLLERGLLARLPSICNTIVSNVPGPPVDLYFGGARLDALHPLGPILQGPAINLTVLSTRDTIGFGLVSCPDLVPDLWEIVDAIEAEFEEYREGLLP